MHFIKWQSSGTALFFVPIQFRRRRTLKCSFPLFVHVFKSHRSSKINASVIVLRAGRSNLDDEGSWERRLNWIWTSSHLLFLLFQTALCNFNNQIKLILIVWFFGTFATVYWPRCRRERFFRGDPAKLVGQTKWQQSVWPFDDISPPASLQFVEIP
jgi:hypothetical protein